MKKVIAAITAIVMTISMMTAFAEEAVVIAPNPNTAEEAVENTSEEAAKDNGEAVKEEAAEEIPPETEEPSAEDVQAEKINAKVTINMELTDHPIMVDTVARINLYDSKGNHLGMDEAWVGGITKKIQLDFEIKDIAKNEEITAKFSGLRFVTYNDKQYFPSNDIKFTVSEDTKISMMGDKPYELKPVIYIGGEEQNFNPMARVVNGVTMVPVYKMARAMGLSAEKDQKYNSVAVSIGDKCVAFNIGSTITNVFGEDVTMNMPTTEMYESVYVPLRAFADYFDCSLEVKDFGDHIDVIVGDSEIVKEYSVVNRNGISSRTNYLIYIDKSDFRVRVYQGSQYKWKEIKSYPCAIGAPGTPTITGQYEYFSKESIWPYNGYYVGPIMRFYNGYAIHSTLRYYGGGEYDGRVGVMISHGCIRLHPEDIEWMWNNIPLYTKIYITE